MAKGSIEWEYEPEEGLTVHVKPFLAKNIGEIKEGMRARRREGLLVLRDLIDAVLKHMEPSDKESGEGHTKIEVE